MRILVLIVITIVACFLAVYFFNKPALFESFSISDNGEIGDVIGGITSPIIGLVSIILLYSALIRQIENNDEQQNKNNVDFIVSLLTQIEGELVSIYYKEQITDPVTGGIIERKFNGLDALDRFTFNWCYNPNVTMSTTTNVKFSSNYTSKQLMLLIRSFRVIESTLRTSTISGEVREILFNKLSAFYDSRLKYSIVGFSILFRLNNSLVDNDANELLALNGYMDASNPNGYFR